MPPVQNKETVKVGVQELIMVLVAATELRAGSPLDTAPNGDAVAYGRIVGGAPAGFAEAALWTAQ